MASQLLAQLLIPLHLAAFLVGLGLLLGLLRWRRLGAWVAAVGLAWGLAWSLPATSLWAGGRLEQRYPALPPAEVAPAPAIVVLGGHTANNRRNWFEPYDSAVTTARVDTAAALYHAGRAPRVVVSGAALDGGVSEARLMANALRQRGVPESAITLEEHSDTTYENALYTGAVLLDADLRHVLLVTSALHMPRAMAVFRARGITPVAAPSPPQIVAPSRPDFSPWLPDRRSLDASRSIIKEYMGLLVYWLRGWT